MTIRFRAALRFRNPTENLYSRGQPDYVRFERPPVIEPLHLDIAGFDFEAREVLRLWVVGIELDQQFSLDWPELVEHTATVLSDPTYRATRDGFSEAPSR